MKYCWRVTWTEVHTTLGVWVNGIFVPGSAGAVRVEHKDVLLRREYKTPQAAEASRRDLKLDSKFDRGEDVKFVLEPFG